MLTSCASGTPQTTSADAASGPVDGGDLVFAIANDPISLNPSGTGSGNDTWYVTRQLVDSLLYQDPETSELEPWLATSYTANADATVFTFELRDDVTFSDGTALTAESVKATFDDIIAAGALSPSVAAFVGYQETVAVDDDTVEVHFAKPNAAFPNATAAVGLGIVGASTLAVPYEERADGAALVGTGPFTLESYTKDVSTVLDRRDDYAWSPAVRGNDGAAHLDTVTFQVVPEASVRTGGLESDQFDVIGGVQPTDVADHRVREPAARLPGEPWSELRTHLQRLAPDRLRHRRARGDRRGRSTPKRCATPRSTTCSTWAPAHWRRTRPRGPTRARTSGSTPTRPRSCSTTPGGSPGTTASARRTASGSRST